MSRRYPPRSAFCEVFTQGQWRPALILFWLRGRSAAPDEWFAQVVINSINEPGNALELMVAEQDVRPV